MSEAYFPSPIEARTEAQFSGLNGPATKLAQFSNPTPTDLGLSAYFLLLHGILVAQAITHPAPSHDMHSYCFLLSCMHVTNPSSPCTYSSSTTLLQSQPTWPSPTVHDPLHKARSLSPTSPQAPCMVSTPRAATASTHQHQPAWLFSLACVPTLSPLFSFCFNHF